MSSRKAITAVCAVSAAGLVALSLTAMPAGAVDSASGATAASTSASASSTTSAPTVLAAGTSAKVSGKLKGKVKHIIVLGPDGKQVSKITPKSNGSFSGTVTKGSSLQLIGTDGAYAGPLVLGQDKKGKLAYTYFSTKKLSGKINLGTVNVKAGYAKTKKAASTKVLDTSKGGSAVATKGVPVGAKASGVIEVATSNMLSSAAATLAAADLDRDGYPNVFDVDVNGNKIFNNVDTLTKNGTISPNSIFTLRATRAKGMDVCPPPPAEKPAGCTDPTPSGGGTTPAGGGTTPAGGSTSPSVRVFSNFKSTSDSLRDVVNANLMTSLSSSEALAKIDAQLKAQTSLAIEVVTGGSYACAMAYCPTSAFSPTAGSTGDFQWPIGQGVPSMSIAGYDLTHSTIGSGDAFTVTTTDGSTIPGVLNFAFTTNPALKSYQIVTGGTAGAEQSLTYTDAGANVGTRSNPIKVPVGSSVKLNWYVPQRLAVDGETGFGPDGIFVNMGLLGYYADMPNKPQGVTAGTNGGNCKGGSLANGDGTAVTGESVSDTTGDDATEGRTFSFVVNIDKCVDNLFGSGQGAAWTAADFDIKAQSNEGDNSALKLYFGRP